MNYAYRCYLKSTCLYLDVGSTAYTTNVYVLYILFDVRGFIIIIFLTPADLMMTMDSIIKNNLHSPMITKTSFQLVIHSTTGILNTRQAAYETILTRTFCYDSTEQLSLIHI